MRYSIRFCCVVALVSGYCSAAIAQRGVVRGRITNSSDEPQRYANIMFKPTHIGGMTDLDGYYAVGVPAGRYVLTVMTSEYRNVSDSIAVDAGDTLRIDVVLHERRPPDAIREIRVTPSSTEKDVVPVQDEASTNGASNIEVIGTSRYGRPHPMDSARIVYHTETKPVGSDTLTFQMRYEMVERVDSVRVIVIAEGRNTSARSVRICGCLSFWSVNFMLGPEQLMNVPLGPAKRPYDGPSVSVPPIECASSLLDCEPTVLGPGEALSRTMIFSFRPANFAEKTGELHIQGYYFGGAPGTSWVDTERIDLGVLAVPLRPVGTIGRYR